MQSERRPVPQLAGLLRRLRDRFRRAEPESTSPGLFTARRSPAVGTEVPDIPDPVVPTTSPSVTVHVERLERPSARVSLTPSQALELAREGHESLHRRRPRAG